MIAEQGKGFGVVIAAAGKAAALPGWLLMIFSLPVLEYHWKVAYLVGIEVVSSVTQMPAGLPEGTLAKGQSRCRKYGCN